MALSARAKRLRRHYLRLRLRERRELHQYRLTRKQRKEARAAYLKSKEVGPTLGQRALAEARSLIGVMESGGNNRGPLIDKIIRANGGILGEPYCGDGAAYVYRKAGSKAVSRSWAAVRLLGGLSGIKKVSDPKPGDLVRFNFDHVALFEKRLDSTTIQTIEFNTSPGTATSDPGSGGIFRRTRSTSLVKDYLRVTR